MQFKTLAKRIIIGYTKNIMLKNVNKTNFSKYVLLTYITRPFVTKRIRHTNAYEALNLAQALQENLYNVDVIFYESSSTHIDYSKYDAVIGFGAAYIQSSRKLKAGARRIYLATGACFIEANYVETDRWLDFIARRDVHFTLHPVDRFEKNTNDVLAIESFLNTDSIISVGGDWSNSTYRRFGKEIYRVGAIGFSAFSYHDFCRDLKMARKSFICITGNGWIHKGVDLLIEAFAERKDEELYIVGYVEPDIMNAYKRELSGGNIHCVGFINMESRAFFDLANKCAFSVNASCSEGCSTSILSCMMTGIIPIHSDREGIDAHDFGVKISSDISTESINAAIDEALSLSENEIRYRMRALSEWAELEYSRSSHLRRMKYAIKKVLDD